MEWWSSLIIFIVFRIGVQDTQGQSQPEQWVERKKKNTPNTFPVSTPSAQLDEHPKETCREEGLSSSFLFYVIRLTFHLLLIELYLGLILPVSVLLFSRSKVWVPRAEAPSCRRRKAAFPWWQRKTISWLRKLNSPMVQRVLNWNKKPQVWGPHLPL